MKYVPNLVTVVAVIIGIVCFGQAHSTELTDPFKNMKNDSFFSESNSDSLDSDFDKKMDDMFSTIKRAQKSVENTKLGPMGRYVLGRNLAARVFGIYKPVELSDPRLAYLRTVAVAIIKASRRSSTYIDPVVILLDAPDVINAFAAPGGFIFITTGMLDFLKNEDELAFVLAHEVAHIELDHGLNAIKQNEGAKIFAESTTDENGNEFFAAFQDFAEIGFSQNLEGEADIRGVQIISELGYDFTQGIEVIRRLEEITSRQHGTGYPNNRQELLRKGAQGKNISAEAVEARKQRYRAAIQK